MDQERINDVIRQTFQLDELPPEVNQDTIENWDSMGHLRLVMALEKALNVQFSMQEIPLLTSASEIAACLEQKAAT